MENYLVNYEKLCYKNLSSLTSILEIKSTELISINEKRIGTFDLWLSDSNLLLIDNIKGNNPNFDLPSNYICCQINSPLARKKGKSIIKDSFRFFRYDKDDDYVFNASDLIIANFVKILNRDFLGLKKVSFINIDSSLLRNDLFNKSFGFKSARENENNLISKDLENKKFTEKITHEMKDFINNKNINNQNLSFKGQNEDFNSKIQRKRDSEDLQNIFGEEFAPKQIKLENETLDYNSKYFDNKILNSITQSNQIKADLVDKMDIENENIYSKAINLNDNNHISNNSTNNTQFLHNSYLNTGNNNCLNQSTNSNIIIEQPSKEQDLTFTPQNSNRLISFNSSNNNMTNDMNKEKNPLQLLFYKNNKQILTFQSNTLENKIQDNQTNLDNQIGKMKENMFVNYRILNEHFEIDPSLDDFTFNKNIDVNSKENNNCNFYFENSHLKTGYVKQDTETNIDCQTNHNLIENNRNAFVSYEIDKLIKNDNINRISLKSNWTLQNSENNNADLNSFPLDHNNKDIPISKISDDKHKLKKNSDGFKRLTLSKNYVEDNINCKEFISASINQKKLEFVNSHEKNNLKCEEEKMDIIYSEKIFESETANSVKNNHNEHNSNKDKSKNIVINSDSNIKNSKNEIIIKNKSNKENKNKGQNPYKNNNKENEINNHDEQLNETSKQLLNMKNISNFKDNLQSKYPLNKIDMNNQSTDNKKENLLNSLINKNFASKQLEKTLERSKLDNKNKINFLQNKDDNSKNVSNFKEVNHQILATKPLVNQKLTKLESTQGNITSELKAEKNLDIMDLKIKKILDISSYDESQSHFTQSELEKETFAPALKYKNNNEFNKINNLEKAELNLENSNPDNILKEVNFEGNINVQHNNPNQKPEQKDTFSNGNQINQNDLSNKDGNMQQIFENSVKEESDLLVNNKCISQNFEQSRVIEIENNLVKNICVYELTDETPNSSDYDESNDGQNDFGNTPFFNQKKKKVNPQWTLDKSYIKQKIVEQNNKKLYEEAFGKRLKIEFLDLRSIFSTDGTEFDLRGESADWKIDNTMSSRRYNRQSKFYKIDEDLNDNNDQNHLFSNFKKTSRNLYNDFQP